jgi:glycosyltransferase involved in cell wall biosynthesis
VPPCDPPALAKAIESLVGDERRAWRLGQAAQAHVRTRYSFDTMVRRFEAVYDTAPRMRRFSSVQMSRAAPRL